MLDEVLEAIVEGQDDKRAARVAVGGSGEVVEEAHSSVRPKPGQQLREGLGMKGRAVRVRVRRDAVHVEDQQMVLCRVAAERPIVRARKTQRLEVPALQNAPPRIARPAHDLGRSATIFSVSPRRVVLNATFAARITILAAPWFARARGSLRGCVTVLPG